MTDGLHYVDCSSHNGIPNIAAYKAAGHQHLCRKVSEGVGYHWADGDGVTDQAHAAGLHVGHYHWLRPDADAKAQADYFVQQVRPHLGPAPKDPTAWPPDGDWLMGDFERTYDNNGRPIPETDTQRANQLSVWAAEVQAQLPGYPLCIYTGNWYLQPFPTATGIVRRFPVVMSDYSNNPVPDPYGLQYVAVQFTDKAAVPGFSGGVDYNYFIPTPGKAADVTISDDDAKKIAKAVWSQYLTSSDGTVKWMASTFLVNSRMNTAAALQQGAGLVQSVAGLAAQVAAALGTAKSHAAKPAAAPTTRSHRQEPPEDAAK